jgi:hypothetical protein
MRLNKLILKYLILFVAYIVLVRFIEPYAMRLYYSVNNDPSLTPASVEYIQSVMVAVNFLISLAIVIFMIFDSKGKKAIDWLIFVITFFSPEPGLSIFIIWQVYKVLSNKYAAQQGI